MLFGNKELNLLKKGKGGSQVVTKESCPTNNIIDCLRLVVGLWSQFSSFPQKQQKRIVRNNITVSLDERNLDIGVS